MRRGTHTASPTAVGTLSLGRLTSQNSLCVSPSGWATRETEIWRPLEAGNKRSGGTRFSQLAAVTSLPACGCEAAARPTAGTSCPRQSSAPPVPGWGRVAAGLHDRTPTSPCRTLTFPSLQAG